MHTNTNKNGRTHTHTDTGRHTQKQTSKQTDLATTTTTQTHAERRKRATAERRPLHRQRPIGRRDGRTAGAWSLTAEASDGRTVGWFGVAPTKQRQEGEEDEAK